MDITNYTMNYFCSLIQTFNIKFLSISCKSTFMTCCGVMNVRIRWLVYLSCILETHHQILHAFVPTPDKRQYIFFSVKHPKPCQCLFLCNGLMGLFILPRHIQQYLLEASGTIASTVTTMML